MESGLAFSGVFDNLLLQSWWLIVLVVVMMSVLALGGEGVWRSKRSKRVAKGTVGFSYRVRDDFLSPAEISFFHVLSSAAGTDHFVFPKVRLSDVLFVARPNENLAQYNQISQKHVDFLVCRREGMKPVLCVELDDSSHRGEDPQGRDEFKDRAFEAAGMRLMRVHAQRQYNVAALATELGVAGEPPTAIPQTAEPPASPLCPKCGVPMVKRVATNGTHKGDAFWGCVNYPRCREVQLLRSPART